MVSASATIPVGYKQTEIGVIPEDWGVVSLVDIVDSSRSIRYGIVQPGKYDMHGRYMIRGQDYSLVKGWASPDEFFRVTPEVEIPYKNARVKTGDLIMTIVGYCGHVEEIPEWLDGANLTQTTARIAILPRKADSRFCKYVIQSEIGLKQVGYFIKGAAQPGLNCGDVEKFRIPLPSVHEQRKISHQIFTINQFIGSMQQLIEKKQYIKQGTMQELLTGKTRLPGFSGEWSNIKLGEIGVFSKGRGVSAKESQTGDIPCIRYGEIYTHHHDVITKFTSKISEEVAATSLRLKSGDILFAGSGETREDIGKCVAFIDDFQAYAGGDIVILRPKDMHSEFLGFYLNSEAIRNQKANLGQGDAVVHIYSHQLSSIAIRIPEINEQQAIAEILSNMDAEITALEQRLEKTKAIKQGMMQQLLTGRIRLVDPSTTKEANA